MDNLKNKSNKCNVTYTFPCDVNDTVYLIDRNNCIYTGIVIELVVNKFGITFTVRPNDIDNYGYGLINFSEFGERVFKTEVDAKNFIGD